MKQYFDYFEYLDEYDENRSDLLRETDDSEKHMEEEEKPSTFIEGEKDPVRIYLKEMSSVPLLTREGEIEIARRMEEGKEKVYRVIFSLPFVLNKLIMLGRMSGTGEVPLTEIIQNGEEQTEEELRLESTRFFAVTKEIDRLNRKRKTYLARLKEMAPQRTRGKAPAKSGTRNTQVPVRLLEENRSRILEKVRDLRLKEDVVVAFSEELKKSVAEVDTLQKNIAAISRKAGAQSARRTRELRQARKKIEDRETLVRHEVSRDEEGAEGSPAG